MTPVLVSVVLLVAPFVAHAQVDCRVPGAECTLREAAAQAGVWVGGAVSPGALDDDAAYEPTLVREMNSLTPENDLKWRATHPAPGVYDFTVGDRLVALAEANGMRVRGHTLLWDQALIDSTPEYVTDITDPEELRTLMAEHITTVVGHYRGRIETWDVVNEPLETGGTTLYDNVFHRLLGPGYIAEALALAHAADPDAVLVVNEVLVANGGPKFDALLAIATDLLAQGAPLHGIGIQGHFFAPPDPAAMQASIEALAALGLRVELTEVDDLLRGAGDLATKLARQGEEYRGVVAACTAVPACRGVTMWGFTDRYTWIDSFLGPGFAPLPLDVDYQPKPAYVGIRDGLLARLGASRLAGSKLVLRTGGARGRDDRLVVSSSDPMLMLGRGPGSLDDPTKHGGAVRLRSASGGGFDVTYVLPSAGWRSANRRRPARGWVFAGAGAIRKVRIRTGRRLTIIGGGSALGPMLDADPDPVDVELTLGGHRYCLRFGGETRHVGGKLYRAAGAEAPGSCNGLVDAAS